MQIVVVSSPGRGPGPHWSKALTAEFCALSAARGATVRWLAPLHSDEESPAGGDGVQVLPFRRPRAYKLSQVAASQVDVPVERAMTDSLRAEPRSVVVHVGLGGQGAPNVLWLADRLGSRTFACVRGAELVCHRGDLLDRDKRICSDWSDADRCRWCCSTSWWSKPRANDLRNRVDLFLAALITCEAIAVPEEQDVERVTGLGVAAERVQLGSSAEALVAHVFGDER